jgi:hypothetical protein
MGSVSPSKGYLLVVLFYACFLLSLNVPLMLHEKLLSCSVPIVLVPDLLKSIDVLVSLYLLLNCQTALLIILDRHGSDTIFDDSS